MKSTIDFAPAVPPEPRPMLARDLELAARDAERRQRELDEEARTANSLHARESIWREARANAERARRLRAASTALTEAREAIAHLLHTVPSCLTTLEPEDAEVVRDNLRALHKHVGKAA